MTGFSQRRDPQRRGRGALLDVNYPWQTHRLAGVSGALVRPQP